MWSICDASMSGTWARTWNRLQGMLEEGKAGCRLHRRWRRDWGRLIHLAGQRLLFPHSRIPVHRTGCSHRITHHTHNSRPLSPTHTVVQTRRPPLSTPPPVSLIHTSHAGTALLCHTSHSISPPDPDDQRWAAQSPVLDLAGCAARFPSLTSLALHAVPIPEIRVAGRQLPRLRHLEVGGGCFLGTGPGGVGWVVGEQGRGRSGWAGSYRS